MEDRELIVKTSAYIDRHRDEMLSLWEKIVSIESGTPDKEGVDRVGAVLKDELESAGVETAVIPMERFGNLLTHGHGIRERHTGEKSVPHRCERKCPRTGSSGYEGGTCDRCLRFKGAP